MILPNIYRRLVYLQFNKAQYLNTGLQIFNKTNHRMVFEVAFTSFYNYNSLFGSTYDADTFEGWCYNTGNFSARYNNSYYSNQNFKPTANTFYNIDLIKTGNLLECYVDGILKNSASCSQSSTTATLRIGLSGTDYGTFRLKGCKIYADNDDTDILVANYIPVERNDNTLGFYDEVSGNFLTRSGSGSFTKGSYIANIEGSVEPLNSGSIQGLGIYNADDEVSLLALANIGKAFKYWEDDESNFLLDNPYVFSAYNDRYFIAHFRDDYQVSLDYDETLGTATYNWGQGNNVNLSATPFEYAQFKGWYIDDVLISRDLQTTYEVNEDTTFEARFGSQFELWIETITDRTITDIQEKTYKAFINTVDLNRIESDTGYLASYLIKQYPQISGLTIKTNWNRNDIPTVESMERIRSNAERILRTIYSTESIATFNNVFTYENANQIELALQRIKDYLEEQNA